jgi:pyruvate dehydrogenase E2 component (dihydrolipoamide acetyltransferase)
MATEVKLPALSESVSEGVISEVRVKPGDSVSADSIVCVVEAEKSTVEVPAEVTGKVTEVSIKKGDKVTAGQVLCRVEGAGAPAGSDSKKASTAPAPKKEAAAKEPAKEPAARPVPATVGRNGERVAEAKPVSAESRLVPAGPATRRLARKLGVELERISGSGPRGRVTQDDVIAFSQRGGFGGAIAAPPALPDFAKWGAVDPQPLDMIRRKTAEQMHVAWSQIPHVTQHDLADITELDAFRRSQEGQGPKLTVTAFALKAAAIALKEFPHFNSSLDLASDRLIKKQYWHIGVAVDTDRGLLVPVIRDVDRKSVHELAGELIAVAEKARQRKISIEEMKGGTFTITNLGGIGGVGFTPIINHPEVAILGLSRARLEPVVKDGQVVPRLLLPLSLSYDHRVIDGADGARFTRRIAAMLENPLLLALEA